MKIANWLDSEEDVIFEDIEELEARLKEDEKGLADDDAEDEPEEDNGVEVDDEHQLFLRLQMEERVVQAKGTFQCWFLSIFEGLHQSGLNFEIILNDPRLHADDYGPKEARPVWQKIFESKMEELGVISSMPRPTKTKPGPKGKTWDQLMTDFFNLTMPTYQYAAREKHIIGASAGQRLGLLPDIPASDSNGVLISPDATMVRFYTVDKKGHAMYYLGKTEDKKVLVYNQQKQAEEAYDPAEINFLAEHTFIQK